MGGKEVVVDWNVLQRQYPTATTTNFAEFVSFLDFVSDLDFVSNLDLWRRHPTSCSVCCVSAGLCKSYASKGFR